MRWYPRASKRSLMGTIAVSKPLVSCIGCKLRSSLTDLGRRRITGWLLDSSLLNSPPLLSESRESSIARRFLGGGSKVCAACDEHELSELPFCIRVGVETLNSHVFPVLKDGHQLNGRGCNIHYNYKDSLLNNHLERQVSYFFRQLYP